MKEKIVDDRSFEFIRYLLSKQSISRFGISVLLSILIASILGYLSHSNYWKRTIFRTQTVDFNMLANILPGKISDQLIRKDYLEIQKTIDSNYGLFGIIITNCKISEKRCLNQEILYVSSGTVTTDNNKDIKIIPKGRYSKNWQKNLSKENIENELFLILRDPPPRKAEVIFNDVRDEAFSTIKNTNQGNIIGRIYLLRNPSPSFIDSLMIWLNNISSSSSGTILYNGIALATGSSALLVWLLCESLFYKNRKAQENISLIQHKLLIARTESAEAKNIALEAENRAYRFKALWEGFHDTFASTLSNKLEELQGLLRRLDIDINNIVHDIRKAPLLSIQDDLSARIIENIKTHLLNDDDPKSQQIFEEIIKFVKNIEDTIISIDWVLKDLREVSNIESEEISVKEVVQKFLNNLPPSTNQSSHSIKLTFDSDTPLHINCNDWHLRSILKNVIYNSTSILDKYQVDEYLLYQRDFVGEISIRCYQEGEYAVIQIVDNGPGFPDEALNRLFQTSEIINTTSLNRGRGSLIVYSYLCIHKAKAKLSNITEGGAEVKFLFPLNY